MRGIKGMGWVGWRLMWMIYKKAIIKKYHQITKCRRGWHKLMNSRLRVEYMQFIKTGKRTTKFKAEFLKCKYCDYLFFPSKEDKEQYLKYLRKKEREDKKLLGMMLKYKKVEDIK